MNKTFALFTVLLITVFFASCSNPVMSTEAAATELGSETIPEDTSEQIDEQKSEAGDNVEEIEESSAVKDSKQEDTETGESEGKGESDETDPATESADEESDSEESDNDMEENTEEGESENRNSSSDRPEWAKSRKWDKIDWNGFDWQNMTLQEVLDYLGIKGKHLGWDK